MLRRLWFLVVLGSFAGSLAGSAFAEVKKPWRLDFAGGEPQTFTYADAANQRTNLVYIVFTLTNKTEQDCPIMVDVMLHTNRGKFYRARPMPGAEEQIICQEQKLGGFSVLERSEKIKELKAAGRFISLYELFVRKAIKAGESVEVLATFPNVAYNMDELYVYVSGLVDPVRYNYEAARAALHGEMTADSIYEIENHSLMLTYRVTASESYVQFNRMAFVEKKWLVRNFGPIADKATVKKLIDCLGETAFDKVSIKKDEGEEEKNLGEVVKSTVVALLKRLLDQDFGYDPSKSTEENDKAVKKAKEWWALNSKKLVFDEKKNVFHLPEE